MHTQIQDTVTKEEMETLWSELDKMKVPSAITACISVVPTLKGCTYISFMCSVDSCTF